MHVGNFILRFFLSLAVMFGFFIATLILAFLFLPYFMIVVFAAVSNLLIALAGALIVNLVIVLSFVIGFRWLLPNSHKVLKK